MPAPTLSSRVGTPTAGHQLATHRVVVVVAAVAVTIIGHIDGAIGSIITMTGTAIGNTSVDNPRWTACCLAFWSASTST